MNTPSRGSKGVVPPPAPSASPGVFDRLDAVMRELLSEHERLLEIAAEHRRAIMQADMPAMAGCSHKQMEMVHRIASLERCRQQIVSELGSVPAQGQANADRTPRGVPSMRDISHVAPEPARTRLLSVSGALRELLNTLHREHQAIKSAAETLSAHMEGLMRQVLRQASHAGTYQPRGGLESTVQVVSSLDIRS